MKNWKDYINWEKIFQIALIAGIVYLAVNNVDGWGWLVFILLITL